MKSKLLLLVVLALALPLAAFADTETFVSVGGTFSGNSAGYCSDRRNSDVGYRQWHNFHRRQSGHRVIRYRRIGINF